MQRTRLQFPAPTTFYNSSSSRPRTLSGLHAHTWTDRNTCRQNDLTQNKLTFFFKSPFLFYVVMNFSDQKSFTNNMNLVPWASEARGNPEWALRYQANVVNVGVNAKKRDICEKLVSQGNLSPRQVKKNRQRSGKSETEAVIPEGCWLQDHTGGPEGRRLIIPSSQGG